jgi:hypothetical protein
MEDCIVELNLNNTTKSIIYATTEHFKIKNIKTNKYLDDSITKNIFPPNNQTGYYLDIVRLLPSMGDNVPGQIINLTCGVTIGTVKINSMFNSNSLCYYTFSTDDDEIEIQKNIKIKDYEKESLNQEEIELKIKDWVILDALRITKKNSFDYKLKSICAFKNKELVINACDYLNKSLDSLVDILNTNPSKLIEKETSLMENTFMITIPFDDYTIGKSVEYVFYEKYFNNLGLLSYCGFKKLHPHDKEAYIRIGYKNADDILGDKVKDNFIDCINILKSLFNQIKEQF